MRKQRIMSLVVLAVLTTIAAGFVWKLAMRESRYAQFVAEATAEAAGHFDQSTSTLKQISDSLVIAKRDNKRVLLQFGAKWCTGCLQLHKLFEADDRIKDELKRHYIVVMVDVTDENNSRVNENYGKPVRFGLPETVILDSSGRQLLTQDIDFVDEGAPGARIDFPSDVLAFLKKWSPELGNARIMTNAIALVLAGHSSDITNLLDAMSTNDTSAIELAVYAALQRPPSTSLITRADIRVVRTDDGLLECVIDTNRYGVPSPSVTNNQHRTFNIH
jgi:thiol-disulfide isomerase/thioredoxin